MPGVVTTNRPDVITRTGTVAALIATSCGGWTRVIWAAAGRPGTESAGYRIGRVRPPRDPADRLLIGTAIDLGRPLIDRDA